MASRARWSLAALAAAGLLGATAAAAWYVRRGQGDGEEEGEGEEEEVVEEVEEEVEEEEDDEEEEERKAPHTPSPPPAQVVRVDPPPPALPSSPTPPPPSKKHKRKRKRKHKHKHKSHASPPARSAPLSESDSKELLRSFFHKMSPSAAAPALSGDASSSSSLVSSSSSSSSSPSSLVAVLGEDGLVLGVDCGTQSLKAVLMDARGKAVGMVSVSYDSDLSHYGTSNGVLQGSGLVVTAPSMMFVEALELCMNRLAEEYDTMLPDVRAVSCSGQQHGSVYWKDEEALRSLDVDAGPVAWQLQRVFGVRHGPVWMDSSTSKYCRQLEERMGGAQRVADVSGSRAYERFTGNQIAKLAEQATATYEAVERISLISSLLTSLLIGSYAPIDVSDGSGMNLLDIHSGEWSHELLEATAGSEAAAQALRAKLGEPVPSHSVVGRVHPYYCGHFNFNPDCRVVVGTGDNPSSLVGLHLRQTGDVAVSLGTSDTLFCLLREPQPSGREGHVLKSPLDPDSFMALLCFKNGSLARQHVRDRTVGPSWTKFNAALAKTPPGNNGHHGLYYFEPEITPVVNTRQVFRFDPEGAPVDHFPAAVEARAVVESQCFALRLHSQRLGLLEPKRVIATGGGSVNTAVLQILANVFEAPVFVTSSGSNAAALGAALRAAHGLACEKAGAFVRIDEVVGAQQVGKLRCVCSPQPEHYPVLRHELSRHAQFVDRLPTTDTPVSP